MDYSSLLALAMLASALIIIGLTAYIGAKVTSRLDAIERILAREYGPATPQPAVSDHQTANYSYSFVAKALAARQADPNIAAMLRPSKLYMLDPIAFALVEQAESGLASGAILKRVLDSMYQGTSYYPPFQLAFLQQMLGAVEALLTSMVHLGFVSYDEDVYKMTAVGMATLKPAYDEAQAMRERLAPIFDRTTSREGPG